MSGGISPPDLTPPTIVAHRASPSVGYNKLGDTITLTLSTSEAVVVAGGTPTLTLNDGGFATYDAASSTSTDLVFTTTIANGQNAAPLAVTAVNLNSAAITDAAGNNADLSGASVTFPNVIVDTLSPTIVAEFASPGRGAQGNGSTIALQLSLSEAVVVAGGPPTLSLNTGGVATYNPASSTPTLLVFTTTVAPGQNAAALAVTGVFLNNATVMDAAGNAADLSGAYRTFSGLSIDTMSPAFTAVTTSPGQGVLKIGDAIAFQLSVSEPVSVLGGVPTLQLNNGGTATYDAIHSTPTNLVFTTTVVAGQDISALAVSTVFPNGATISDAAGNVANLANAIGTFPRLSIDATAPTLTSLTTTTSATQASSLIYTVSFSEVVNNVTAGAFTLRDANGHVAAGTVGTPTALDRGQTYSVTVSGLTADGTVHLDLNAAGTGITDLVGNALAGGGATGTSVTIDRSVPAVTVQADTLAPAAPTLVLAHDSGASNTDRLTNDATLALTTAEAGGTLSYTVDGVAAAAYDPASLSQGAHTVGVRHADAAGNISAAASLSFVLDSLAPNVLADNASGRGSASLLTGNVLANDTDASPLHLSAIQFGTTTVAVPGTGSVQVAGAHGTLTVSAEGNYSYQASTVGGDVFTQTVTDAAGNASQTALSLDVGVAATQVYRFYDKTTGDHFYTADAGEAAQVGATLPTFAAEGTPWGTPDKGTDTTDVYRFLDINSGEHFFTTSMIERDSILHTLPSYHYEGVGFQAYAAEGAPGTEALARFYNAETGQHHFALSDEAAAMRQGASGAGWVEEGKAFVVHTDMHGNAT